MKVIRDITEQDKKKKMQSSCHLKERKQGVPMATGQQMSTRETEPIAMISARHAPSLGLPPFNMETWH